MNNHRKGKRVSYSSDTDSTDSSSSSRTSCSSSSSDSDSNDSDPDTYTSDTSYTSQTSQTSHTRTSDSSDSDSSDYKYRRRHRLNKHRRPPSETSDTSETSSSDDDDDENNEPGKYVKRRNQSMKRTHSKPSTSNENCVSSRKRKLSESHRSEELLHHQRRKMRKSLDVEEDEPRQMSSRMFLKQRQHRFNVPATSSAAKVKKCPNSVYRSAVESTSAGDFIIK